MQKLSVVIVLLLLVIASCTKKAVPTAATSPKETPSPKVASLDGGPLYAQNCSRCHGASGVEGRAPNLKLNDFTKREIIDQISKGSGRMPAFATKLSANEIGAVAEFVIHLKK